MKQGTSELFDGKNKKCFFKKGYDFKTRTYVCSDSSKTHWVYPVMGFKILRTGSLLYRTR